MNTDIVQTNSGKRNAPSVSAWGESGIINFLKMIKNILSLAKECPNLQVSITLGDLVEANTLLIADTKRELEQLITDQNTETYPSREKVMEMLGVCEATLWRWAKNGYLVPLNVGGKRRYRMSDVKRILEGQK